jgi:hypothetical protein
MDIIKQMKSPSTALTLDIPRVIARWVTAAHLHEDIHVGVPINDLIGKSTRQGFHLDPLIITLGNEGRKYLYVLPSNDVFYEFDRFSIPLRG